MYLVESIKNIYSTYNMILCSHCLLYKENLWGACGQISAAQHCSFNQKHGASLARSCSFFL